MPDPATLTGEERNRWLSNIYLVAENAVLQCRVYAPHDAAPVDHGAFYPFSERNES